MEHFDMRPSLCPFICTSWLLAACLTGLTGCAGTEALKRREGPEYAAETASWREALDRLGQSGMWLVTRGYHKGDDLIAVASNAPLSHASILDKENQAVVEAIGEGVVVTDLGKFLEETHRLVLVQPERWTPKEGLEALARARSQVGQGYDFLGIVGIPQEERWYCSELAAWSMGIRVNHRGPQHVLHPLKLLEQGQVLFDSKGRDGAPEPIPAADTPH